MIGKLIVHRKDRETAIKTTIRALKEFKIEGIKTTIPLAIRILEDPVFQAGTGDTAYVERELL